MSGRINRHYQQAATDLEAASEAKGPKALFWVASAAVHAMLFIGQKIDTLTVEYRTYNDSETHRVKREREITGSGVIR